MVYRKDLLDIRRTNYALTLSLGLLTSLVTLDSFLAVLWGLSGPADISLGEWGVVHISAYLVWTALFYAGVGTWFTVRVGQPLVQLNFAGQPPLLALCKRTMIVPSLSVPNGCGLANPNHPWEMVYLSWFS